jgi:hypothetical protein
MMAVDSEPPGPAEPVGFKWLAIVAWKLLPVGNSFESLTPVILVWLKVSVLLWRVEQKE